MTTESLQSLRCSTSTTAAQHSTTQQDSLMALAKTSAVPWLFAPSHSSGLLQAREARNPGPQSLPPPAEGLPHLQHSQGVATWRKSNALVCKLWAGQVDGPALHQAPHSEAHAEVCHQQHRQPVGTPPASNSNTDHRQAGRQLGQPHRPQEGRRQTRRRVPSATASRLKPARACMYLGAEHGLLSAVWLLPLLCAAEEHQAGADQLVCWPSAYIHTPACLDSCRVFINLASPLRVLHRPGLHRTPVIQPTQHVPAASGQLRAGSVAVCVV
jgi:hypothetical protein